MKKCNALILGLGLLLALAACSQSKTVVQDTQTIATPSECATFDKYPMVVAQVKFKTEKDFYDLAVSFEFVGGSLEERYVLIDVDKTEFERLKVTAAIRGWNIKIDEVATQKHNADHNTVEAGGSTNQGIENYSCYRTVEETYQTMEYLAQKYPNLVTVKNIGPTWQKQQGLGGYDMKVLIIGNKNTIGTKPQVVMTSSIHAREYAPAEVHTRLAEYLLDQYGKDADITWMLDSQQIHLILQANPDGRKKAEKGSLWRKNTNNTNGCQNNKYGTDLNRNFAFLWNKGGSSKNPCSDTYMGSSAASEPEVQNIQNYLKSVFPDSRGPRLNDKAPDDTMGIYIDTHSYSQLVLWSWGHTNKKAPNGDQLQSLGRKLAYFNGYKPQQAIGLYASSGTTEDYGYGELGIPSYTLELGSAFFEKCSDFAGEVFPKNKPALLYAIKAARAPYIMGSAPDIIDIQAPKNVEARSSFTLTAQADNTRFNNRNGVEPSRRILSAEYFIDQAPWDGGQAIAMQASDGHFNNTVENIKATVSTAQLNSGKHIIYIRAKNTSGHYGPVSAVFLNVQRVEGQESTKNQAPMAGFQQSADGLKVSFNQSSSDIDGRISHYVWDFGDGTSSNQANPLKTYRRAGVYKVNLTVTDNTGLTNSIRKNIKVFTPRDKGSVTWKGEIRQQGTYQFIPNRFGFKYSGGKTLTGSLINSRYTDFDLYLQKKNGTGWNYINRSASRRKTETIKHNAFAGTYRWVIHSYNGIGSYIFKENK